jgi:hypothetical protein
MRMKTFGMIVEWERCKSFEIVLRSHKESIHFPKFLSKVKNDNAVSFPTMSRKRRITEDAAVICAQGPRAGDDAARALTATRGYSFSTFCNIIRRQGTTSGLPFLSNGLHALSLHYHAESFHNRSESIHYCYETFQ